MAVPNWDEEKHPRVPKGSEGGGQFAPGGGPNWSDKDEVSPKVAYHVTFTKNTDKIKKDGIKPFQTSLWTKGGDERYTEPATIYAFENKADAVRWAAKMDWDFNQETGSGKISIVTLKSPGRWKVDRSDPLSQSGAKGRWLKRIGAVPADSIGRVEIVTTEMIRDVVKERR